jgi:hypothetical protein
MIDRNRKIELTEEELEDIIIKSAKVGADLAIDGIQSKLFMWAGRGILSKIIYLVGAVGVSIFFYLHDKGLVKP